MIHPKLSIIVPVYNAEHFLSRALESLRNQIEKDIEIIVVDDGSTDSSADICDQFAQIDSRFRVLHITNGGVSKARNKGLQFARGEIVTFVDSDDWVVPEYCTEIIHEMYGVDLLVFKAYVHHADGIRVISFNHCGEYTTKDTIANALSDIHYPNNYLGWPWNKAFRRDIVVEEKLEFPTDISLFEDEVFVLKYCSKISSTRFSHRVLYHYCVTEGSLSFRYTSGGVYVKVAEYIDVLASHFSNERFLSGLYWQVMWLYIKAYKSQQHMSYKQFVRINHYYKSRLPIIRSCPAKVMHYVFGHFDMISYFLYMLAHSINKI